MALLTKGLKKSAAKRKLGYKGSDIRPVRKQMPGTKKGVGPAKKGAPGIQKVVPMSKGTTHVAQRPVRDIPGGKKVPGVKKTTPVVKKPNRSAHIAAKKKAFAQKRANKLANQKKLAARKRALAKKKKMV